MEISFLALGKTMVCLFIKEWSIYPHYAGLTKLKMQAKHSKFDMVGNAEIEELKEMVKKDPEVSLNRERLLATYNKALDSENSMN